MNLNIEKVEKASKPFCRCKHRGVEILESGGKLCRYLVPHGELLLQWEKSKKLSEAEYKIATFSVVGLHYHLVYFCFIIFQH